MKQADRRPCRFLAPRARTKNDRKLHLRAVLARWAQSNRSWTPVLKEGVMTIRKVVTKRVVVARRAQLGTKPGHPLKTSNEQAWKGHFERCVARATRTQELYIEEY